MLRVGFTIVLILANVSWLWVFYYIRTHAQAMDPVISLQVQSQLHHVQSFVVSNLESGADYELRKVNADWFLEKPFKWAANSIAVETCLQQLLNLDTSTNFKIYHEVAENDILASYGLNPPAFIVRFKCPQREYVLHIGQKIKSNHRLYVYEPETRLVFVCKPEALGAIFFNETQWCNTYFFQSKLDNVQSLTYDSVYQHLILAKEKEQWYLKNPLTAKASNMRVETVIQQIQNMEVLRFLDDKEVASLLQQVDVEKQISTLKLSNEARTVSLKVLPYNEDQNVFVAQGEDFDKAFLFKSTWASRLESPQESLRERQIFNFPINEVCKITYTKGQESLELKQIDGQRWDIMQSCEQNLVQMDRASYRAIYGFLKDLKSVYVEKFLDHTLLGDLGPTPKSVNVKVVLPQSEIDCTLYQVEDDFYLKLKDDLTCFKLALVNAQLLEQSFDSFRDKQIWHWNHDEHLYGIQWLSKTGEAVKTSLLFKRDSINLVRDPGLVQKLEPVLRVLNAKHFVHLLNYSTPLIPFIFAGGSSYLFPQQLMIKTIDAKGRVRTYNLALTCRLGGNLQLACYRGKYFTLPQSWIDAVFSLTELSEWQQKLYLFHAAE